MLSITITTTAHLLHVFSAITGPPSLPCYAWALAVGYFIWTSAFVCEDESVMPTLPLSKFVMCDDKREFSEFWIWIEFAPFEFNHVIQENNFKQEFIYLEFLNHFEEFKFYFEFWLHNHTPTTFWSPQRSFYYVLFTRLYALPLDPINSSYHSFSVSTPVYFTFVVPFLWESLPGKCHQFIQSD